jgi:hypothetical protein
MRSGQCLSYIARSFSAKVTTVAAFMLLKSSSESLHWRDDAASLTLKK